MNPREAREYRPDFIQILIFDFLIVVLTFQHKYLFGMQIDTRIA